MANQYESQKNGSRNSRVYQNINRSGRQTPGRGWDQVEELRDGEVAPSRQAKTVPPLGRTVNPDQIWPSDTMNTLQGAVELWDPAIKYLLWGHDVKKILQVQNY